MDTIESDAADLLTLLVERNGIWRVPSELPPDLATRARSAGNLLEERGQAFWYCASLSEQLRGHEPYVLCLPGQSGARFHVSVPDGRPKEPLYPRPS